MIFFFFNKIFICNNDYFIISIFNQFINAVLAKAMKKLPSDERLQNASDALKNRKKIKMQAYNTLWLQLHLAKMPEGIKQYQTLIGRQKITRR